MNESNATRPGWGQWLIFLALAAWLAIVPLMVTSVLAMVTQTAPGVLVDLGLLAEIEPLLPAWAFGLLSMGLTLGLDLLVFVPLWLVGRQPGRELLRTAAALMVAIALYQALSALPGLLWPDGGPTPLARDNLAPPVLRLALTLPFLLFGLGWVEAQHRGGSLLQAWRRVGLRLWLNPSAFWLALAASAVIVGPWVLVGSLGSVGTTAANALQALPNALGEEILFRGFALAWLWRVTRKRTWAAGGSLILFVAAQGGAVLPHGRLGGDAALCLGAAVGAADRANHTGRGFDLAGRDCAFPLRLGAPGLCRPAPGRTGPDLAGPGLGAAGGRGPGFAAVVGRASWSRLDSRKT